MNNTFSTTQAANITALVGVIVLILNHFHVNIGSDEISGVIGGVVTVVGIIVNWINRYKKGDITIAGFHKMD